MNGGVISVDGHALDEPYVSRDPCVIEGCGEFHPVVVPGGHFFVMGDNRGNSDDSRRWGFVPRELVIGVYRPGDSKE
jgi:signal peptidase I